MSTLDFLYQKFTQPPSAELFSKLVIGGIISVATAESTIRRVLEVIVGTLSDNFPESQIYPF